MTQSYSLLFDRNCFHFHLSSGSTSAIRHSVSESETKTEIKHGFGACGMKTTKYVSRLQHGNSVFFFLLYSVNSYRANWMARYHINTLISICACKKLPCCLVYTLFCLHRIDAPIHGCVECVWLADCRTLVGIASRILAKRAAK